MYSAAKTDDLRSGLLWMLNRWKRTEFVLMGFSLGANVVAKYMGEEGDSAPVRGALVLATPFDLKMGSDSLASSPIYDKAMAMNLTRKVGIAAHALSLDPDLRQSLFKLLAAKDYLKQHPNDVKERGVKPATLKWVDDSITRLAGGYSKPYGDFPFQTADDYYNANGSIHFIHNVARPMLCLNSDDDPIVPYNILTATKQAMATNPNVAMGITRGGGHLGWWSRIKGSCRRWLGAAANDWTESVFQAAVSEDEKDYMQRNNPWLNNDIKTVSDVTYELLSEDELLDFEPANAAAESPVDKDVEEAAQAARDALPSDLPSSGGDGGDGSADGQANDNKKNNGDANVESSGGPPRHAWLRTQILPAVRLIHPSQHPDFQGIQFPAEQERVTGNTMVQCISRPQVGYLELPASSRVAGCGEVFQGGKAIPGQSTDTKGERVNDKRKGSKAKGGLREKGTIAGL